MNKSAHSDREERIFAFWKEKGIFQKTLDKKSPRGEFVFYEGPPTANGHPGIHHLEARAFKDAIPRYKTMCGYHVRRKGGWDTHGLPVEIQVEKELGLRSKKEIEKYGIEAFNQKCKESVWKYVNEWEQFTDRIGYWVDLKHPYITYKPKYIESVWNVIKTTEKKGLLYKDYKVVPWCPRCGTALSSHELAQGYEDVKDLSLYVRFKIISEGKKLSGADLDGAYFLAWTTTPWTLPGNVALAVGAEIEYVLVEMGGGDKLILAKDRLASLDRLISQKDTKYSVKATFKGSDIVGLKYEPVYTFFGENISGSEKEKLKNAYKVYSADFVTTADGTGIVHIAVMYGQDDFDLGTEVGLPKYHLVNDDGTFRKEAGFLSGKFVKEESTDVEIIKDLASRNILFAKEKYSHTYPFCWRCHTPLMYFARDSWYVRMSELRDRMIKESKGINWEPSYIKEGRFGEWLRDIKDWAISRERYWGTPLPIWICRTCGGRKVAGSIKEISKKPRNTYYLMRHGEAQNNIEKVLDSGKYNKFKLTDLGRKEVERSAKDAGINPDIIICSPLQRTRETAAIFAEKIGFPKEKIEFDDRLCEIKFGDLDGKSRDEYSVLYKDRTDYFKRSDKGVENYTEIKKRVGSLLDDIEKRHEGKTILLVSHDGPLWMIGAVAGGLDMEETLDQKPVGEVYMANAEIRKIEYSIIPHNAEYELDLHKPFIDEIKLECACGGEMERVKEVMDVWFDSGSMPFAEEHYPFEKGRGILGKQKIPYPADFISEAIDQTRGWFYTLHAVGTIMGKGKAYKNVICLGHLRDAEGKKMSKSIGNIVDPNLMMDKYGADALRFWMYSINDAGDSKNFDEKTVDEIIKKVFNLTANVISFYKTYDEGGADGILIKKARTSENILDKWIISRLDQMVDTVTKGLDSYTFFEPSRSIRDFIGDLSQWYLRRSRERFKGEDEYDKSCALATTRLVLITLAKVMAPMTPFFAEHIYQELGGEMESVHLESWPKAGKADNKLIESMKTVRYLASKGLEARMSVKINVRQPLAKLVVRDDQKLRILDAGLMDLIKDEVNVKEISYEQVLSGEVALDTIITPELKEEGDLRELLRKIQDLRKEGGLKVGDMATLVATADMEPLISKNIDSIKKATSLRTIEYGDALGLKR